MINKNPLEPTLEEKKKEYQRHIQTCPSSIEQVNAKARLHKMSYGKYVLALSLGQFADEKHKLVPLY